MILKKKIKQKFPEGWRLANERRKFRIEFVNN